ncbi:ATP-dependent DNA helicase RecG [Fictibacillus macauensis ZFHKF-1]|uniref:ATP-dependent DNA helicase RecG n=1 Tax=Fictibacillus macauensis ZFHKF-1 TaxID=1196324 RepID=I8UE22_9BACL|nr:ATP-dependent DNA helicase RecG [Fictibacillus macauensis]EIT85048.1 ATP-dependent DNA helicase RecG [Fictibacillus macauensis ZFHKF-1]
MKLEQLSVTDVNGVGDSKAEELRSMGILSVHDLLNYLPFRYDDHSLKDLSEVKHEERATVEGKVHSEPSLRYFPKKKSKLSVRVLVGRYLITAVFFNQHYVKNQLSIGQTVTLTGKWDVHKMTLTVNEVKFGIQPKDESIDPVYTVRGRLGVKQLRRFIKNAFLSYGNNLTDKVPESLREMYKLLPINQALYNMHFPQSYQHLKHARRRMVYEELLLFQLKMQMFRKINREQSEGKGLHFAKEKVESFIASLPFPLTSAQRRVTDEILKDLTSNYRMNRLLQGDVGSGKTVVAAIALYAAVEASTQGALMVPTEILAEQHFQSLESMLSSCGLSVALLTSSVKGKRRKDILSRLADGEIDVLIGTHALIQEEVVFKRLGLVITDEQHRFGVKQRRVLREKGENPDVLFMTATPIPRTLAISVFGDMDVSVIDEMPAGRKVIETYWAKHHMLDRVLGFVQKELDQGRQAYVICPLIEESDKLDVQNAIDVHAQLQHYFKQYKVGLMHGRLTSAEKEEVMREFATNACQLLVSTTVVEVGVNVPNATMMVIYDAERFGLSQLHQLRGRVGRGSEQSYCILISDAKSQDGKERMRIMTETSDGFVLSQKDLELRGPGDFFGNKQSGLPDFKVADVVHDYRVLEVARNDAARLVNGTELYYDASFEPLKSYLEDEGVFDPERLD